MEVAVLFIVGVLAGLAGFALGRYAWPATPAVAAELVAARLEAAHLSERTATLQVERDVALNEKTALVAEIARLGERVEAQRAQAAAVETRLTTEFENIANRVLRANAAELSENSQKALTAVVDPLRERIQDFQSKVERTYESETRQVLELKEQIRLAVETSREIGGKADGLAAALRGDSQRLGRWGEVVLERILETAGLCDGREYIAQGRGLGLRNEAGGLQRPDILVLLPENRTIVIDSKVPLSGYERLIAAEEDERQRYGDDFVRDVKGHIDGLSGKRYQENDKLSAHDCVLMFVPIEGALAAALRAEPELFAYGWDRRVVLVGPSTLLMTMRTVASLWRSELQGQNAREIARLAGQLCDKVYSSLGDLNLVADKINAALGAHNDAVKRLSTGRGNALSIGEHIRSLGVKTSRPLPAMLIDGVRVAAEAAE